MFFGLNMLLVILIVASADSTVTMSASGLGIVLNKVILYNGGDFYKGLFDPPLMVFDENIFSLSHSGGELEGQSEMLSIFVESGDD